MATCSAISAFFPSVVAKSIFAPRRADKSLEAEAAPVSILNATVAAVQVGKMGEGISAIVHDTKDCSTGLRATDAVKAQNLVAESDSIFNSTKKAVKFGLKHANVNGMIGGVALLNALYSEDKESSFIQNGSMFLGMLGCEGAHKLICGSSSSNRENGINNIEVKDGLYRKNDFLRKKVDSFAAFCEKQEKAMQDCGEVKRAIGKVIKYTPAGLKGLSFAGASIGGSALFYWLGGKLAEEVTGREN